MVKITTSEFNQTLMEMLCYDNDSVEENICLISKMPLDEDHITLCCNHTFNYSAILNEVRKQKPPICMGHLEIQKLSNQQIKCPYCRTIQNGLLPYKSGYQKINYVNWPTNYQYLPNTCSYTFISGKRYNQACGKKCLKQYCLNHTKIMERRKKKIAKKCAQKIMAPLINKIITEKSNNDTCSYIYKKGKNKGYTCSCNKIYDKTLKLCTAHYKYYIKCQKKRKKTKKKSSSILSDTKFTLDESLTLIKPLSITTSQIEYPVVTNLISHSEWASPVSPGHPFFVAPLSIGNTSSANNFGNSNISTSNIFSNIASFQPSPVFVFSAGSPQLEQPALSASQPVINVPSWHHIDLSNNLLEDQIWV